MIVPAATAQAVWDDLVARGASLGLTPCGLGCRDTLRLEAAMPLYGHELNEQIDPITAGLQFAVKLSKRFLGRDALQAVAASPIPRVRVGLFLEGKRIAREHTPVVRDGGVIGEVTSGTFSPTLQRTIAMAYVDAAASTPGTAVQVDLRGKLEAAEVTSLPFYRRSKS